MKSEKIFTELFFNVGREMIITCRDAREADECYVELRGLIALDDRVLESAKRGNGVWQIKLKNRSRVRLISRGHRDWEDKLRGEAETTMVRTFTRNR